MGFGGQWLIWAFLFWVGVVFMVVWAVMRLFPGRSRADEDEPVEILRRRYASGEITREQYDEMRQVLEGDGR